MSALKSARSCKLLQLTAACSVAIVVATAGARAQSEGSWVMKAPVPAALAEVAVAYAGGMVHVMGGSVLGFTGPYHVEYDPGIDKWRARSPLPRPLDHMGSRGPERQDLSIGGFVGGGCTVTARTPRSNMTRRSTPGVSSRR